MRDKHEMVCQPRSRQVRVENTVGELLESLGVVPAKFLGNKVDDYEHEYC